MKTHSNKTRDVTTDYVEKAKKLYFKADSLYRLASCMATAYPYGHPLLMEGHADKRYIAFCQRIDRLFDSAEKVLRHAERLESKANAISQHKRS